MQLFQECSSAQTMTIQIPERTPTPRSSVARIYSVQSRLRFLPVPRKTPHVHIKTPTFIGPLRAHVFLSYDVGIRLCMVWQVSTDRDFDINLEVFPDVATANRTQLLHVIVFDCPWRLNTIVDTKHYVSHCTLISSFAYYFSAIDLLKSLPFIFFFCLKCFVEKRLKYIPVEET